MEKKRLSLDELVKMTHSELVSTMTIQLSDDIIGEVIFGDNKVHTMTLDVFDGFAYCGDCEGKEYYMHFPKLELVGKSKSMQSTIREFMNLGDSDVIKVSDVMACYYTLVCNSI